MRASETGCLTFAPSICAEIVNTFPVWEVLAGVVVTALVTILTIRVSVAAATRETKRTITASLEAEQRAGEVRQREAAGAAAAALDAERVALASAVSRAVHEVEALQSSPRTDPQKIAAYAHWQALRTTFAVARVDHALDVYDYADLMVERARNPGAPGAPAETFLEFMARKQFADEVSGVATEWARTGQISDRAMASMDELRVDHAHRQVEWMKVWAGESAKAPE